MKFSIRLLCALCPCMLSLGRAVEPSDAGGKSAQADPATKPAPQALQDKMWYVPIEHSPSFGTWYPDQIPQSEALSDVREWLQNTISVNFVPGEEAIFTGRLRVLVVRAKPETIELIDKFARQWKLELVRMVPIMFNFRVEVSLVEFSTPKKPELNGKTSFKSLRRAAGDSWRVLNQMQVMVSYRSQSLAISKTGTSEETPVIPPPEKDQSQSMESSLRLRPREFGATLYAEPVEELPAPENGEVVNMILAYHFRAPGPLRTWNWKTVTIARITAGRPTLVRLEPASPEGRRSHPTKFRGLIVRFDVVPFGEIAPHPETHADAVPTPPPLK